MTDPANPTSLDAPVTADAATSTDKPSKPPQKVRTFPQTGILNRPPEHALLVALRITADDPRAAVDVLRNIVHAELRSNLEDMSGAPLDAPPAETGELGFVDGYDRNFLTITVGFSVSGLTRFGATTGGAGTMPADLIEIPWARLGDTNVLTPDSGDVVVQICADSIYLVEHVLRRIETDAGALMSVVWTHTGTQRYSSRPGRTARREGRALIGFLDGTSNLDPRQDENDRKLVFVDPDHVQYPPRMPASTPGAYGPSVPQFPDDLREPPTREPGWTKDGTYMVVRASLTKLPEFDHATLGTQQSTIGRFKVSGVSLDLDENATPPPDADTPPAYSTDPNSRVVPLNSHVRKTNPRGPEDPARRIFRRGYPLLEASGGEGLRRGLLFISFARTLTTQFEFITAAWMMNPNFPEPNTGVDALRQFEGQVLAGGYYFVPPLTNAREPWSWALPPATDPT